MFSMFLLISFVGTFRQCDAAPQEAAVSAGIPGELSQLTHQFEAYVENLDSIADVRPSATCELEGLHWWKLRITPYNE